jgi:type I restriction enzyme, S subunit
VTGWTETALRDLFTSSVPGEWGPPAMLDEGVPVLRSTNFRDDGSIDYTDVAYRRIPASRLTTRGVKKDTILIEKSGGSPKQAAGRAVFVDADFAGTASNFIQILTVADGHSARFVAYLLQHLYRDGLVHKYQQQTTGIINFKLDAYLEEKVVIPVRKEEQTKIAEVLWTLDRAIVHSEALTEKQERIKRGLMQDLLSRGLDESGKLRSETTHRFQDSEFGRIPEDWWVATAGELFEQRVERGRPGLPVMSVVMERGLVERVSVERRVESKLPPEGHALVLKDDITYNMMRMWQGVLGRAHYDCIVSPAYVVLKPRSNIRSCFAEWLLRDARSILKFRRASRGVVDDRLRLYAHDLFPIKFAIPKSRDEQDAIAKRLEASKVLITTAAAASDKLRRLRTGLMDDLFTRRAAVEHLLGASADGEQPN